jgi:hypothetical protein
MSTRSSIWLGESDGKSVHIYWELADLGQVAGHMTARIYLAVDDGNADNRIAVRLPKDIAARLFAALRPDQAAAVDLII